jgi:hypothetical protein
MGSHMQEQIDYDEGRAVLDLRRPAHVVWTLLVAERSLDGDADETAVADVILGLKNLLSTTHTAEFPQAPGFLLEAQQLVTQAAKTLDGTDSANRKRELRQDLIAIRKAFEAARDSGILVQRRPLLKRVPQTLGTALTYGLAFAWVGSLTYGLSVWRATGSIVALWVFLGSIGLLALLLLSVAFLELKRAVRRVAKGEAQLVLREVGVFAERLVGARPQEPERTAVTAFRVIRRGLVIAGCVLLAIAWVLSGGQSSDLAKVAVRAVVLPGIGLICLAALGRKSQEVRSQEARMGDPRPDPEGQPQQAESNPDRSAGGALAPASKE